MTKSAIPFLKSLFTSRNAPRLNWILFLVLALASRCIYANEAYCNDPDSPDSYKGKWVARFDVLPTQFGPLNYITFLGFQAIGSSAVTEVQGWSGQYEDADGSDVNITGGNSMIYATPVSIYFNERVQSPNGRCQVYPTPYAYPGASLSTAAYNSAPKAFWIGDSVMNHFTATLTIPGAPTQSGFDKRTAIATNIYQQIGYALAFRDESGMPFQDFYLSSDPTHITAWQSGIYRNPDGTPVVRVGRNFRDEIRGAMSSGAKAVIVELGINDAHLDTLVKGMSYPQASNDYSTMRNSFINNINGVVQDAKSNKLACLIFITPPDVGSDFVAKAELTYVRDVIRNVHNQNPALVTVIDWADLSRNYHQPDNPSNPYNTPSGVVNVNDWFLDDQIHPNNQGDLALLSQLQLATQACNPPSLGC